MNDSAQQSDFVQRVLFEGIFGKDVSVRFDAQIGMDDATLSEKVKRKQEKYLKAIQKFKETEAAWKKLGLPMRHPHEGGAACASTPTARQSGTKAS